MTARLDFQGLETFGAFSSSGFLLLSHRALNLSSTPFDSTGEVPNCVVCVETSGE